MLAANYLYKGLLVKCQHTLCKDFILTVTFGAKEGMKFWCTNKISFVSYTTLTPHTNARRDFHTYVMSHFQYTYMYKTSVDAGHLGASLSEW